MTKSKAGQPTVMTEKTLQVLKDGFLMGFTNEQACLYAGIGLSTFRAYKATRPEYQAQIDQYKQNLKMQAKVTTYNAVTTKAQIKDEDGEIIQHSTVGDADLSLKILDRLERDNYSTKVNTEHTGDSIIKVVVATAEDKKLLDKI